MIYRNLSIDQLYELKNNLEYLIKFAQLFGKVKLGGKYFTIDLLKSELEKIKFQIASKISNNHLKLIKK